MKSNIWSSLRVEVRRHGRAFQEAKGNEAELARFENVGAVAAALARTSGITGGARSALIATLVRAQREQPHPLWQSLLLLAFEPLLRSIRGRLGGGDADDLDQEVIVAFLEAVMALHPSSVGPYVVLALNRATKKAVFAGREPTVVHLDFDDELHGTRAAHDRFDHLGEVLELSSPELRAAMLAVYEEGESLREFVDRRYLDQPAAERVGTYDRLRRERDQVFASVRALAAA